MKRIMSGLFLFLAISVLLIGCESNKGNQTEGTKTNPKESYSVNLTDNEVKEILNELIPKAVDIYGMFNPPGSFKIDATKKIPGEAGYAQVIEENVQSVADIKKMVGEVFTEDFAQDRFYSNYLTPDEGGDPPLYKDYEGKLYVDADRGGHGWATEFLIDTARLKEQKDHIAEIELDVKVLDEPSDPLTIRIENVNGKWLLASGID